MNPKPPVPRSTETLPKPKPDPGKPDDSKLPGVPARDTSETIVPVTGGMTDFQAAMREALRAGRSK